MCLLLEILKLDFGMSVHAIIRLAYSGITDILYRKHFNIVKYIQAQHFNTNDITCQHVSQCEFGLNYSVANDT